MPKGTKGKGTQTSVDEVSRKERLHLAMTAWKDAKETQSIRKTARKYGVPFSTLRDRLDGAKPQSTYMQSRQRLTPEEEEVLVNWMKQLQEWEWPSRVCQLRGMAEKLLREKGDMASLGINWVQAFLKRHPELKTRFSPPLDKERALAQNPRS